VLSPLYQVSTPGLSMLQSEEKRYERYYHKLLTLVCLATMPASVFVAVYASEVTHILLGPKWAASAPIVAILCLSVFIKQPIESTSMILVTRQQSKRYFALSLAQNLAFVAAVAIGVRWGLPGIAWADVALTYILIIPKVMYALRDSPVSARGLIRTLARPMAASLGMGAVLFALKSALPALPAAAAVLSGAVIAAAGFLAVWLIMPGGKAELMSLVAEFGTALRRKKAQSAPA
jgi:PST family polysaccharide transporter